MRGLINYYKLKILLKKCPLPIVVKWIQKIYFPNDKIGFHLKCLQKILNVYLKLNYVYIKTKKLDKNIYFPNDKNRYTFVIWNVYEI